MQLQLIANALIQRKLNLRQLFRTYVERTGEDTYVKVIRFTHFVKLIRDLRVFRLNDTTEGGGEAEDELSYLIEEMLEQIGVMR